MEHFAYQDGLLFCDGVSIAEVSQEYGTPIYIYSEDAIRDSFRAFSDAFAEVDPLICYALKANYSLAVCKILREEGAGFDIVSGGELFRALKAGADPKKICYAGVGKTRSEIEYALNTGILMFNVESGAELDRISAIASNLRTRADLALRLNPDVDPYTHEYTTTGKRWTKFGIGFDAAAELVRHIKDMPSVHLVGLHVHLGSPINSPEPYRRALDLVLDFLESCRDQGARIQWLDVGGGFGIEYKGGETAGLADFAQAIIPAVKRSGCRAILQPGRYIVGNAAVLVTRVQYVKQTGEKKFVICDAGMNDLIRPALYGSYHRVWPVSSAEPVPYGAEALDAKTDGRVVVDIAGPVCESADFLARDRPLPPVRQDDLLAVFSAGAYGYSMSSNYNSRPRGCEVMISGGSARLIRPRESHEQMIADERF